MTPTWASGGTIKSGATECISGATATSMKENGQDLSKMDREQITLQTRMFTRANILTEGPMATGNTAGSLVPPSWESFDKA